MLFFVTPLVQAQQEQGGAPQVFNAAFEIGPQIGRILANQVEGVTEIHPQWGLWTGFGLGQTTTFEMQMDAGLGNGVEWTQLSSSLRMDMLVETLVGFVYIGIDATQYKGEGLPKKIFGGGHVGGGIMSNLTSISKDLWFRMDMKFNINPGTSLYIAGGFVFRFGKGGGGGSQAQ